MTLQRDAPATTVITGATGWLGTAIMTALTDPQGPWWRDGEIRPLVRHRGERDELARLGEHVRPVIGDVCDTASLDALIRDAEGPVDVIHAAGVIHPARVAEFSEVNEHGTRHVVDTALRHDVRRLVHVSSNSPFGTNPHRDDRFRDDEPYHPYLGYGRSKMRAELAVLEGVERGLDAVIVRPPWFYGPHQPARQTTFFTMVRRGVFPVFGAGDQMRSMVYVGDLVQGVVRAELVATPPGRGWWIADERPYSVAEIVETVGLALRDEGYDVRRHRASVPGLVARIAERSDALLQRRGRYHQQIHVLGEMDKHIACTIDGARAELGYSPEVGLHDGMRRSIRWCRDQGIEL